MVVLDVLASVKQLVTDSIWAAVWSMQNIVVTLKDRCERGIRSLHRDEITMDSAKTAYN